MIAADDTFGAAADVGAMVLAFAGARAGASGAGGGGHALFPPEVVVTALGKQ
jgi:hypothetical protein